YVEPPVQEDAVVLECERTLGRGRRESREPRRQLGLAVAGDEAADPLELLAGSTGVPGPDLLDVGRQGRSEFDLLEQPVRRVADLRRREPRLARDPAALVHRAQARKPLGVEAV